MNLSELEQNFYGRQTVLELLKRRVLDLKEGYRQNVSLLGNRYIGKSAIIKHFIMNFEDNDVILIYLDLDQRDFSYFFHKLTASILYNFAKVSRIPVQEDLNLLIESTKDALPQTVQVIRKMGADFAQGKYDQAFLGLLNLPEVFTNETSKFCVLILDEFQAMEEFPVSNPFQSLGKMIMTQKKCLYVMASSYPAQSKKILSEKLSLLFGNFETVMIEPFDLQSSQGFIDHNLKNIKMGFQLKNFLADFTGGHPLYLNLFCHEMANLSAAHRQEEIYLPVLSQAVESIIFNRWGIISRHFELIIKDLCRDKGSRNNTLILMALCDGAQKLDELVTLTGIRRNHIIPKINNLLEEGIVVKNGTLFYLKDKLFKYWLKFVYRKRIKEVELAFDKQRRQFKEELSRLVEEFKINSRKDFPVRIRELLESLEDETLDLNGRKYKLPLFKGMEPLRFKMESGNFIDCIKASVKEAVWFVILKKDNFAEGDVNTVLNEAKKSSCRPQRCLIISLTDLDENARLRALQERCWIWNERELNTLFALFDKPSIVR